MTPWLLVWPHQLFADLPSPANVHTVVLVEEALFFRQYPFHRQKLVLHRASMRHYAHRLRMLGYSVHYVEATHADADVSRVPAMLRARGATALMGFDPGDDWLERRLRGACRAVDLPLVLLPSPGWMTPAGELERFFAQTRQRYLQHNFYVRQRRRLGLLVGDDGAPRGGQWSFDAENRKRYPARAAPPPLPLPATDDELLAAQQWVTTHFPDNPGDQEGPLRYPLTHAQADRWLEDFLRFRLSGFGRFEDAIVAGAYVLHHSVLTPMLNIGLLTPAQVLERTAEHAARHPVALNDLEGFVRQVCGWREFIFGMYRHHGRRQRLGNFWGHHHPLPAAFSRASTGIAPIDATIRKVIATGYCHHIERLMLLGNFMLLCEIAPDEVYRWFMTWFIDAFDWVMVPNVYGMSQFADGGLLATKPYIGASSYVRRMSDHPPGEWCDIWDGLFWRFVHRHRDMLHANPRLRMMVANLDRMEAGRRESLLGLANDYLLRLHGGGAT